MPLKLEQRPAQVVSLGRTPPFHVKPRHRMVLWHVKPGHLTVLFHVKRGQTSHLQV